MQTSEKRQNERKSLTQVSHTLRDILREHANGKRIFRDMAERIAQRTASKNRLAKN